MTKQILLGLALASWWTSLLLGQSPPPPPTPLIQTQDQQHLSTSKQDDSTATPPPAISAAKHDVSAKKQHNERSDESSNSGVNFLAWVVAVATVLQFVAAWLQARYMRRGLKATEIAAEAAKTSADASTQAVKNAKDSLLVTERAVVLVRDIDAYRWAQPGTLDASTVITFTLKNFGRTMACNVAFKGKLEVTDGKSDELPQSASCTLAANGKNMWNSKPLGSWLDNTILHNINEGRAGFGYLVELIYWDVFGEQHSQEVVGDWDIRVRRFGFAADKSD